MTFQLLKFPSQMPSLRVPKGDFVFLHCDHDDWLALFGQTLGYAWTAGRDYFVNFIATPTAATLEAAKKVATEKGLTLWVTTFTMKSAATLQSTGFEFCSFKNVYGFENVAYRFSPNQSPDSSGTG